MLSPRAAHIYFESQSSVHYCAAAAGGGRSALLYFRRRLHYPRRQQTMTDKRWWFNSIAEKLSFGKRRQVGCFSSAAAACWIVSGCGGGGGGGCVGMIDGSCHGYYSLRVLIMSEIILGRVRGWHLGDAQDRNNETIYVKARENARALFIPRNSNSRGGSFIKMEGYHGGAKMASWMHHRSNFSYRVTFNNVGTSQPDQEIQPI